MFFNNYFISHLKNDKFYYLASSGIFCEEFWSASNEWSDWLWFWCCELLFELKEAPLIWLFSLLLTRDRNNVSISWLTMSLDFYVEKDFVFDLKFPGRISWNVKFFGYTSSQSLNDRAAPWGGGKQTLDFFSL